MARFPFFYLAIQLVHKETTDNNVDTMLDTNDRNPTGSVRKLTGSERNSTGSDSKPTGRRPEVDGISDCQ